MRNIYRSLMRNVGHTQWFSDLGKDLVPLDRAVQRVSGGKLSGRREHRDSATAHHDGP